MKSLKLSCVSVCLIFSSLLIHAQIDTINLNVTAYHLFPSFPVKSSFTSIIDKNGRPFLYSANMESGLGIYDISTTGIINPVMDLGISNFNSLDVATIQQRNQTLFIGIGDFQVNTNSASGLAILDITNPGVPLFKDIWDTTLFTHGISHILIQDDFAYLSTMTDGIFILDISDESDIRFVSRLELDLNFPAPSTNAHNARGLKYRNDTLFVSFDRGGLRVIDVQDKSNPVEVYKYINPGLNTAAAAAYNDVLLKDNFAFLSVDYCGLEIIDISAIPFTNVQWYNPWGCNFTNWSGAAIHTNELKTGNNDSLLFVSAAQTELMVFDISDPSNTLLKGEFGDINDTLATHGLDVFNGKISLSYIHTPVHIPPLTPFFSDPGGLKLLEYSVLLNTSGISSEESSSGLVKVFPNPVKNKLIIQSDQRMEEIQLSDVFKRLVIKRVLDNSHETELTVNNLPTGIYFITVKMKTGIKTERIVFESE